MILCCGEALIDMLPSQTNMGQNCFVPKVGGAVFNTAVALGRLSSDVSLFTGVSTDIFGRMIEFELSNSNVGRSYLSRSNRPSTLAFVEFVHQNAKYTFYSSNAADTMLTLDDIPVGDNEFDTIFFGGISLCTDPTASTIVDLVKKCSDKSVLIFDPNIRSAFISDEATYRSKVNQLLALSDIIKLSDEDLNWLVPHENNVQMQVKTLLDETQKLLILTQGEKGATAFYGINTVVTTPALVVDVTDTVGAGDAFTAGLIYSLSKQGALSKVFCAGPNKFELEKALSFAMKIAAHTVSQFGANSPWLHQIL